MERILVVDDDPQLANVVARVVARAGYETDVAVSGQEALVKVAAVAPDVMLLDYEMPDLDGLAVMEALRQPDGTSQVPVLIFTGGRTTAEDEVEGLRNGAIDYIRKGAPQEVLLARIENALRPARLRASRTRIRHSTLLIDTQAAQVMLDGREIVLENRIFALLCYMAERPGIVVSRNELLENVWGTTYMGFQHSVDQAVYQLRKRLGDPAWIKTVQKKGYRFVPR